jgi:feruloyl esterase
MKKLTLLVILSLTFKIGLTAVVVKCRDLPATAFGSEVKIDSAAIVTATATTLEHCEVRGTIWPEAKFAVQLPTQWNRRFLMAGNGGTGGTIGLTGTATDYGGVEALEPALRKGFATASTDTGHDAAKEPLYSFAYPGPNNPNAERKLVDYAYQAVHETAVLAKKIMKTYYGEQPRYSYWIGCSGGGRQGLMEAQRFPADFDGLIVGAPALNLTGTQMRHFWNARTALAGPGAISVAKLPLLANAVYQKCDRIDGLEDGLIDDPRKCMFDPAHDLPKCAANNDGPNCFTGPQIESLNRIYGGVRNSAGKLLFPGQPPGAEVLTPRGPQAEPRSGWEGTIVLSKFLIERAEDSMRVLLTPPPRGECNYQMFNFDTDPPRMARVAALVNATKQDLRPLKQCGGKIIHYHGWADPQLTPLMSVEYYESVLKAIGEKETMQFYRLFMIPGLGHCVGGIGCGTVDWLTPIVDWVEQRAAPEKLIGARVVGGVTKRTRPLCPYPQVAKYTGIGSVDAGENFTCVTSR